MTFGIKCLYFGQNKNKDIQQIANSYKPFSYSFRGVTNISSDIMSNVIGA